MRSLNITPEQFAQLLRDNNVTREQFIALYGLQPLVYIPELPGRTKVAFVLICVLIFALALFGNCLVLYVVTRSKAMRTVTNIFICSLALSDLLIAFFCVPFTMLQNISSNWLGGGCRGRGARSRAVTGSAAAGGRGGGRTMRRSCGAVLVASLAAETLPPSVRDPRGVWGVPRGEPRAAPAVGAGLGLRRRGAAARL
uniref:G-protein coupled receptors family 1 profile domain-containing protein n=1 Tax=Accipiter nisus TaxID=211598 RepID=A0A8B9MHH7_9AVES